MNKILVCDDEKDIVRALEIYLKAEGYEIRKAYNGREAMQMLQEERDQILDARPEDIRALAPRIRNIMDEGAFCVIGNAEAIEKQRDMFCEVRNLFK